MNIHKNARSCPASREVMSRRVLQEHWLVKDTAEMMGLSTKTVRRWAARSVGGEEGWQKDRSSRPRTVRNPLSEEKKEQILELRQQRMIMSEIAGKVGCSQSSVQRVLVRSNLSKLPSLEPVVPIIRYEHPKPGDMLHLDIKRFGRIEGVGHRITGKRSSTRGAGYECLHVAIDDHSRVTYAEILADQSAETAAAFLERAIEWFELLGVTISRVLTDNGGCYRSRCFAAVANKHGLKLKRTRPYTPRTNGKAERMIQTMLREWAYKRPYTSSAERTQALPLFLHRYNFHRQHAGIGAAYPMTRIPRNNVLRNDN